MEDKVAASIMNPQEKYYKRIGSTRLSLRWAGTLPKWNISKWTNPCGISPTVLYSPFYQTAWESMNAICCKLTLWLNSTLGQNKWERVTDISWKRLNNPSTTSRLLNNKPSCVQFTWQERKKWPNTRGYSTTNGKLLGIRTKSTIPCGLGYQTVEFKE